MSPTYFIDAALSGLPKAETGTPLARQVAAIREHLLIAKARLVIMERKEREPGHG